MSNPYSGPFADTLQQIDKGRFRAEATDAPTEVVAQVTSEQPPERWAIVALFGHVERVGRVSEETVAGAAMLRVDIPQPDGTFATRHVGGAAIYEITYVDEATARAVAKAGPADPISPWTARNLGLLPKPELPAPSQRFLAEDGGDDLDDDAPDERDDAIAADGVPAPEGGLPF